MFDRKALLDERSTRAARLPSSQRLWRLCTSRMRCARGGKSSRARELRKRCTAAPPSQSCALDWLGNFARRESGRLTFQTLLQARASFETDVLRSLNFDRLSGARIAARARGAQLDREGTEADDLNAAVVDDAVLQCVENTLERFLGSSARNARTEDAVDFVDQLGLVHFPSDAGRGGGPQARRASKPAAWNQKAGILGHLKRAPQRGNSTGSTPLMSGVVAA